MSEAVSFYAKLLQVKQVPDIFRAVTEYLLSTDRCAATFVKGNYSLCIDYTYNEQYFVEGKEVTFKMFCNALQKLFCIN